MPDITIVKLKIRRGTDAQRKLITLEQGELGLATDTKRVFVGDGSTFGGNIIGNLAWPPLTATSTRINFANVGSAVKGDIVNDHGLLYQLTGTTPTDNASWTYIGTQVDSSTLTLSGTNNILTIKDSGITGSKFATSAAFNGLAVTPGTGIGASVDNTTIKVNGSNQLTVSAINQNNIVTSALGKGLQGGSGTVISLNADTAYFGYNSTTLTLTALPVGTVTAYSLSANSLGTGLNVVGDKLQATINSTLTSDIQNIGGQIKLSDFGNAGNSGNLFKNLVFDSKGRALSSYNSVIDTLSAGNGNYAGIPSQVTRGLGGRGQTLVNTLSWNSTFTNSTSKQLSSAGFITFESVNSQNGTSVDKFAIPIFSYN